MSNNTHDEWRATWDWAKEVWGEVVNYDFNDFFREVARKIAEAEQWEELGSSDVWCATEWMVRHAKNDGVTNREALVKRVLELSGYFHTGDIIMLTAAYGSPGAMDRFRQLFAPA